MSSSHSQQALKKSGFKEYILLNQEENNAIKVKYDSLIDRLQESEAYFDEAQEVVHERDDKRHKEEEWHAFVTCDPLPKPYQPEEIRRFYYKTYVFKQDDIAHTVNWTLGIDECSILTQDIDAPNKTRIYLHKKKTDFGHMYNQYVTNAIEILRRITEFIAKPDRQLSERIMNDVEHMRFITFNQINRYLNNLTYRVLCFEDAYMQELDVTKAEYFFPGKHFAIHIWGFKNVPIYLDPQATPFQVVNLHAIETEINLPFGVLHENMALRGLHPYFDHFSDHARFFELPMAALANTNLKEYLKWEWSTIKQMQVDTRKMLIKQRKDYDEAMALKAEEEAGKARQQKLNDAQKSKTPEKAVKPKKPPKEPQIVEAGYVPDVRKDFLSYEEDIYVNSREEFNPETFHLSPGEVNLRKYQILGGVYQINFLKKPNTTNFPKLIMAWFESDKRLKFDDLKVEEDKSDVSKFFKISITLPECYCLWGEPIPCLFEEGILNGPSQEAETLSDVDNLTIVSPVIINDFKLQDPFDKPNLYHFIEHTLPRIISSFQLPSDLYIEGGDKKSKTVGKVKQTQAQRMRERMLEMQRKMLSYEKQNRPERLFPLFRKVLPVIIMPCDVPEEDEELGKRTSALTHPYQYYSNFFSALEEIKNNYRTSTFKDKFGKIVKIVAEDYEHCPRVPPNKAEVVPEKQASQSNTRPSKKSLPEVPPDRKIDGKKRLIKRHVETEQNITTYPEPVEEEEEEDQSTKWSTANIINTEFQKEERKITFLTDRLGTFGIAFFRYEHLPLQNWSMGPNLENNEEVELVLESKYVRFRFLIGSEGYRLCASDFEQLAKNRKIFLDITEPTTDLHNMKQKMRQKHLNIFPEHDYSFYLKGYFCEKHIATEYHVYKCLCLYATYLKFKSLIWNKLSSRRVITLRFGELQDLDEDLFHIRITPEGADFVEIQEVCTSLEQIELNYTPTWRNLGWYPDLNYLIKSTYNGADDNRLKNPNILHYLNKLLQAIRPLSCA